MGKQHRAASATDNADVLEQVKTALKDESVITHIADRIAAAVPKTIKIIATFRQARDGPR